MAKTRYAPDRGLTARMTLTMFLLGLVFVAFVAVLVLILGATSQRRSGGIVFFAVLLGVALAVGSFFYSDKIALSTAQAVVVGPQDGPDAARLHAIVDRLCALANMPKPRLAIAPSRMLNAFATGRNSKTSVLVATTGLLHEQPGRPRARGGAGPRAVPRRPQGRRGDDHRLVHRHHRRPAGPVRVLLASCSAAAAAAAAATTTTAAPSRSC